MAVDWKKLYFERALLKHNKKKRPPRLPKVLYPERIEDNYAIALDGYVQFIKNRIDARIKPLLPKLTAHYARPRPRVDAEEPKVKYYTAFIYAVKTANFRHCTHKYLGQLSGKTARRMEKKIDHYFLKERKLPVVSFTEPRLFGDNRDTPVMVPQTYVGSEFFPDLRDSLDEFREDDFPYTPHVTTDSKEPITAPFAHYALIADGKVIRTWPQTIRLDADDEASLGDLADQLEAVRIDVAQAYTPEELKRLAKTTGESVAKWNERQLNGQLKGIVEVDLFGGESWLAREAGGFVVQNVSLITSIEDTYLSQVENLIATSVRSGLRVEDIADELEGRFDVSRSRAELIARDQVGKFNGQLTELRQTDLGIDGYTWRDSGDARVRPEHHALDGKSFTWDNPPEPGHPGEDFQCRCNAEPDLAKFFD